MLETRLDDAAPPDRCEKGDCTNYEGLIAAKPRESGAFA